MINPPTREQLQKLPELYATEKIPFAEKLIHLHFAVDQCHWWAMEFDGHDIFFGYVLLYGLRQDAELGYFTLSELMGIKLAGIMEVIHDPNWTVQQAKDVRLIRETLQFQASLHNYHASK